MSQYTKEEIFAEFTKVVEELFDIPAEKVTMTSRLGEDLDLDSIDAVDMIVHLQNFIGERIKPEHFKTVKTVGDVIEILYSMQSTKTE